MISEKERVVLKFVVVVLVCVFISGDDAIKVRCIGREREALLRFKNGLVDDYGFLSSWRGEECCEWDGVVCSNATRHVIALQLDAADYDGVLQGNIGSSLLELHHLNHLDLSNNDFGGNPIPEFIGSMKQLQHLYLMNSGFSGIVPTQIGNITNLQSLDLSYNSLRTQNLDWLSGLSLLSSLDLSQIDLSHTNWFHQILSLPSLHKLHLQSCNLRDIKPSKVFNSSSTSLLSILSLPDNHLSSSSFDWLSNISSTSTLLKIDLSSNALGGPIPNAFERFHLLVSLDLSKNKLESIPKSLVNQLSHLRVLNLYGNHLGGRLDELFANISDKGISKSLQLLDLALNGLNGSVPDLRAFSALTDLYLEGNNFTGSLPLSIGQLSTLVVLKVSGNFLEGLVSESHFIKLNKLKMLDLSFNSLVLDIAPDWNPPFQLLQIVLGGCKVGPSFPKWIQSQSKFSILDLSRTGITDEAPRWLWNTSPFLEALFLQDNQINGTIPSLSSMSSLRSLVVSNNRISGPIPSFNANINAIMLSGNMFTGSISSICEIRRPELDKVDLSNNKLAGEVPICWENLPKLAFLNLANNNFSGEIPPSLASLHNLAELQLRGNNLSGELPSNLRFCQGLESIDVGGNELTGGITAWIGELYHMRFLNLGRNKFHGGIPPEICYLTDIQILDLSVNNFSGKLPDCFSNFTNMVSQKYIPLAHIYIFGYSIAFGFDRALPNGVNMQFLELSAFQWKGQEIEYRTNMVLLKLIDFSSNRLTGNIPQSFSSMKGLMSLNLSRNSLMGNIISDIGEIEKLEILDLSHNQLSGRIPTSLAQLHSLAVLDLSNNSFSGKIPTGTQLQTFDVSAYAGNDGLCGKPLELCPEDRLRPPTTNPKKNVNERGGELSFMQEVGISMGFGFIFGFWGFIGSLVVKKSWRIAFFNFFDDVGDWFYVRTTIFLSKMKRRPS